jgi:hypothetical protein
MKGEEFVHIKLEHSEAICTKRDILNTEASLLEIAKALRQYKKLRCQELETKIKILKKLKVLRQRTIQLQQVLPKIKIPAILKKDYLEAEEKKAEEIEEKIKSVPKEERYENRIEEELREIQQRLRALH